MSLGYVGGIASGRYEVFPLRDKDEEQKKEKPPRPIPPDTLTQFLAENIGIVQVTDWWAGNVPIQGLQDGEQSTTFSRVYPARKVAVDILVSEKDIEPKHRTRKRLCQESGYTYLVLWKHQKTVDLIEQMRREDL